MSRTLGQHWIDFCETQMFNCQDACSKRQKGWLWRIAIYQERLWHRIGDWGVKFHRQSE